MYARFRHAMALGGGGCSSLSCSAAPFISTAICMSRSTSDQNPNCEAEMGLVAVTVYRSLIPVEDALSTVSVWILRCPPAS